MELGGACASHVFVRPIRSNLKLIYLFKDLKTSEARPREQMELQVLGDN